jgi:hypothetical protein
MIKLGQATHLNGAWGETAMTFLTRIRIGVLSLLVMALAQGIVQAGSTGLSIVAFSGGACGMAPPATVFGIDIAYHSSRSFTYAASVVSGPAGLGGTSTGGVAAGTSSSFHISLTFATIATPAPWSFVVQFDSFVGGHPQDRATATIACNGAGPTYSVTPIGTFDISGSGATFNIPCANVSDGRVNNSPDLDCAAPVAIYQSSGLDIYGIDPDSSKGDLSLRLSSDDIDKVGVPSVNTLLASGTIAATGQPIHVYRLTSGEYQLDTFYADGKPYSIIWDDEGHLRHVTA